MHVKNADMYPMTRQKLPSGETMMTFPSPTSPVDGISKTMPSSSVSQPSTSGFSMVMGQNDRMAGSVPVWKASTPHNPVIDTTPPDNTTSDSNDDFGFSDFIDMINPFQHVPIVSHIYRAITGDVIKPMAEIIGGGLFGGPVGAATGAASAMVNGQVGEDIKQAFSGIFSSHKDDYNDTTIAITNLRDPRRYNE